MKPGHSTKEIWLRAKGEKALLHNLAPLGQYRSAKRHGISQPSQCSQQAEHLPDRYRPHRLQPQSWSDSVGKTVEDAALRRRPIPTQLLYRQALSRHQCSVALVERIQLPVLAYIQVGAGIERQRPQRRAWHADHLLQGVASENGPDRTLGRKEELRAGACTSRSCLKASHWDRSSRGYFATNQQQMPQYLPTLCGRSLATFAHTAQPTGSHYLEPDGETSGILLATSLHSSSLAQRSLRPKHPR